MEYKFGKIDLFKKKINAPKSIIDKINSNTVSIQDAINYNLFDSINISNYDKKYQGIINLIGIEKAVDLNFNFIDDNIDFVNSILEKYDGKINFMDFIYAEAYIDIVDNKNHHINYKEDMDIEFKNRFPQLFLDKDTSIVIKNKYYSHLLTIKDYLENLSYFDHKYISHSLTTSSFSKNILKTISDDSITSFVNSNRDISIVLKNDEIALLNIISFYRSNMNISEKKEIFRRFINLKKININNSSLKVLLKYFNLKEIMPESTYGRRFIVKYGFSILKELKLDINDINESIYYIFDSFGINNIIEFDKNNNNFFSKNNYKNTVIIYKNILKKHIKEYESFEDFDEFMYNILKKGLIDYRDISGLFKEKYKDLFLDDADEELENNYYTCNLNAKLLQNNHKWITSIVGKNIETGFKPLYVNIDNGKEIKKWNVYEYITCYMSVQDMFNMMAEYGLVFDNIFSTTMTMKDAKNKKELLKNIEDVVYNSIINNGIFDDNLPAKFKLNNKSLFLDITAPNELKELFYNKQLTPLLIYNHNEYIEYLLEKDLRAGFNSKYHIFEMFDNNKIILEIMAKYGNILQKIEHKPVMDVLIEIFSKKNEDINELFYNDAMLLSYFIAMRDEEDDLKTIYNSIHKNVRNKFINPSTSDKIMDVFCINNINFNYFGKLSKNAFDSFMEQNEWRFTPQFIDLYNNQKTSNYIQIENYINFYLVYKLKSIPEVFKSEFNSLLSKRSKDNTDYQNICLYLRAIKKSKSNDQELISKYEFGLEIIKMVFIMNNLPVDKSLELINNIIIGSSSAINMLYVNDIKHLLYALNINDIYNDNIYEYVNNMDDSILKLKANNFNELFQLISNYSFDKNNEVIIIHNMYYNLGYTITKNILLKKYGNINNEQLIYLFKNISINIVDDKVIYNDTLLKLIFGVDYEQINTPIRNYLNNFSDIRLYINQNSDYINNDNTLDAYEKAMRISKTTETIKNNKYEIIKFLSIINRVFNEWDIITEEFNKAKYNEEITIEQINTILFSISENRTTIDDKSLIKADINNYISNNSYNKNIISMAKKIKYKSKKIPFITLRNYSCLLSSYKPDDKNILTIGFKTNNCFRFDNNNELMDYCINNDYGYHIFIKNEENNYIAFIPVLRNGNTVLLYDIYTYGLDEENIKTINLLIKEYADTLINYSKIHESEEERIKLVLINDNKYVNKFDVINSNYRFKCLDNKITNNHIEYILSKDDDYSYIVRNNVKHNYIFENNDINYKTLLLNDIQLNEIYHLNSLKNKYVGYINHRKEIMENDLVDKSLEKSIKNTKEEYLSSYKTLLKSSNIDILYEYNIAINTIFDIIKKLGKDRVKDKLKEIRYSNNWYICISQNNKLIVGYLPEAEKEYLIVLDETKKIIKDSLTEEEIIIKAKLDKLKGEDNDR